MNIKIAAEKWGISERRVRKLCENGMIYGVQQIRNEWLIDDSAPKPVDMRKFRYAQIPESLSAKVAIIESLKAAISKSRQLTSGEDKRLRDEFLVDYTYNSTHIEGNTLTESETAMVLSGLTIGEKPIKDHLEAVGHRDAFLWLENELKAHAVLAEKMIKDIHFLVLGDLPLDRGKYRSVPVRILGACHEPPQPYAVPSLMEEWIDWTVRSKMHPIMLAALSHIKFEAIHPFIDGNGRTGRLLANYLLMSNGYLPINIKYENRRAYYEAFEAFHRDQDGGLKMMELFVDAEFKELEKRWLLMALSSDVAAR